MSGDLGQRKTSTVAEPVPAASATAAASSSNQQPKETKTMADSQHQTPQKPDFQKLIQLVHSADIQAGNESASALREMLLNGKCFYSGSGVMGPGFGVCKGRTTGTRMPGLRDYQDLKLRYFR